MKALGILFFFLLLLVQPLKAQSAFELNKEAEKIVTSQPEQAKKILHKALNNHPDKLLQEKIMLNLAIVDRVQGDFKSAISATTDLLNKTTSSDIKASAHNNLGTSYNRLGNKEKALKHYLAALISYEKNKNIKEAAIVENNIGLMYQNLDDFEKAIEYHNQALKKFTQLKDKKGLATTYNLIGIVMANQGNLKDALHYFQNTYAIEKQMNNAIGISEALNNIGGIYYYLNNLDSALIYFNHSIAIDKTNQDYSNLADGYNNLAELHLSAEKYSDAALYLDSSSYYAHKTNYHQAYLQALELSAQLHEIQNNLPKAIAYHKRISEIKDSLAFESNRANINELEKKYQLEKKEALIKEEQLKNKNKTLWMFVLGGALIILIALILVIIQRKKMQLQRSTIENMKNLDAERTRIARDLHDNLGAELTLISSKIDVKSYKLTNENDKRELNEIREIASMANNVLRDTIWSIHKHELTADELKSKTLEYLNRIAIHPEIEINVNATQQQIYSPAIALHLFRIIQEATNNAIKYAVCSELTVNISSNRVQIIDNGIGFDIATIHQGYGLQNMKERASEMNAQLSIISSIEKGTLIQVDF